ncbi:hypothetical protein CSIRO_2377 [Bradyrhizobiaceae bacterium SG-6C]|nr:hypothetical protein CSIRO_2377 [Bradyrhizobiaceae bacterium SG-6C]
MSAREDAHARHQQKRWMRPDAHRWVRSDVARFLVPGAAASVYSDIERKYSPNQPRVPAGSGRESGRWTDGGGNGNGSGANPAALPTGNIDFGDLPNFSDVFSLFQITPSDTDNTDYTQLAGDTSEDGGPELPSSDPPEIPQQMPETSAERSGFMRAAANWLGRNSGLAADIYTGAMNNVQWLKDRQDLIQAARDEPKSYEELGAGVGLKRRGYDDHHVVEQTWAEYFGFSRSQIDDPSNVVSIPRLKHYQITGWYGTRNPDYGWLSPREYLSDKNWEERQRVGRDALILFRVLKP